MSDRPENEVVKKKKRKKKRKTAGRIISDIIKTIFVVSFVLCLVVIALGVYLFFSFSKDTCTTDSYTKLIQAEPMTVSERFDISSDGKTGVMRMDKKDLWWLIINENGDEFIEKTKASFQEKNFRLAGYGINLSEDSSIDLDIRWNSIKTIVHVPLELSFSDNTISVHPTGVRILKLNLKNKLIKFLTKIDLESYSFSVSLKPDGFIRSFDGMTISGDTINLAVTFDAYPLKALSMASEDIKYIPWFINGYENILEVASMYDESEEAALEKLLEGCDENPGKLEDILNQYYTITPLKDVWKDFRGNNGFLTQRILYGTSEDSFKESHDSLVDYCSTRLDLAAALLQKSCEQYDKVKITISKDGSFVYQKSEFIPSVLATEEEPWDNYELFIPEDGIQYCLIDTEDVYRAETPALKKFTSAYDQFTTEVDKSLSYPLGYAARTNTGTYFLCYFTEGTNADGESAPVAQFIQLAADEYNLLHAEGKISVWQSVKAETTE